MSAPVWAVPDASPSAARGYGRISSPLRSPAHRSGMVEKQASGRVGCGCARLQIRVIDSDLCELRPGDLIFGNRLSVVQRLNTLSGDSLTHSGVIAEVDGTLSVVELGARGCFTRTVADFRKAYRLTAVGHLSLCAECRDGVASRALELLDSQFLHYSWTLVATSGLMALSRRLVPERLQPRWLGWSTAFASWLTGRLDPRGVTCSGFVVHCLEAADGDCRVRFRWPARQRDRPWRGCTTPTDAVGAPVRGSVGGGVARAVSTPSDLWVAGCFTSRSVWRGDAAVVLLDGDAFSVLDAPVTARQQSRV